MTLHISFGNARSKNSAEEKMDKNYQEILVFHNWNEMGCCNFDVVNNRNSLFVDFAFFCSHFFYRKNSSQDECFHRKNTNSSYDKKYEKRFLRKNGKTGSGKQFLSTPIYGCHLRRTQKLQHRLWSRANSRRPQMC